MEHQDKALWEDQADLSEDLHQELLEVPVAQLEAHRLALDQLVLKEAQSDPEVRLDRQTTCSLTTRCSGEINY